MAPCLESDIRHQYIYHVLKPTCLTRGLDKHKPVLVSGHSGFRRLHIRIVGSEGTEDPGRPCRKAERSMLVVVNLRLPPISQMVLVQGRPPNHLRERIAGRCC